MLVEFADVVAHFINVLQLFGYINDLFSSTNLDVAVSKLLPEAKRRWFAHLENKSATKKLPTLMSFNEWLENEAVVYERLMSEKRSFSNDTQQSVKTLKILKNKYNFPLGAVGGTENAKKVCVHCKKEHQLWNCQELKDLSLEDKYFVVK